MFFMISNLATCLSFAGSTALEKLNLAEALAPSSAISTLQSQCSVETSVVLVQFQCSISSVQCSQYQCSAISLQFQCSAVSMLQQYSAVSVWCSISVVHHRCVQYHFRAISVQWSISVLLEQRCNDMKILHHNYFDQIIMIVIITFFSKCAQNISTAIINL